MPGQVIFVLILHVFNHKSDVSTDEYGNPDLSHVEILVVVIVLVLVLVLGVIVVLVVIFIPGMDCRHDIAGGPLHRHARVVRRPHHYYRCRLHDEGAEGNPGERASRRQTPPLTE